MFSEKLKQLRKNGGISQEQLSEKIGVSRQTISKWESGEVLPDTENALLLSKLFGVSLDYLLKDETAENSATTEEKRRTNKNGKGKAVSLIFVLLGVLILGTLGTLAQVIPSRELVTVASDGDTIAYLESGETRTETIKGAVEAYAETTGFFPFLSTYYLHWLVVLSVLFIVFGLFKFFAAAKREKKAAPKQ